ANNVIDGLAFIEHIQESGEHHYPYGLTLNETASADEAAAIDAEVERLLDTHDAVGDLVLAEGVHQATQGNFERAAAMLDTGPESRIPTDLDVIRTPRSGTTLTHRAGIHFPIGLPPTHSVFGMSSTARSECEPALDQWLSEVLPDPEKVVCTVSWDNPVTSTTQSAHLS